MRWSPLKVGLQAGLRRNSLRTASASWSPSNQSHVAAVSRFSMPLRHDLYFDPQFGGVGIGQSWIDRAQNIRRHPDHPEREFDRFVAFWMAFNAWGVCVTLAETGAEMIRQLGRDRDVEEIFNLILQNTDMARAFEQIAHNFPLPSFSDLLRLDPNYNWRGHRDEEYWKKIAGAPRGKRVRISPAMKPENLVWSDVLSCTYKVRCNLMHGGKMANREEAQFVGVFADLLDELLTGRQQNVLMLR